MKKIDGTKEYKNEEEVIALLEKHSGYPKPTEASLERMLLSIHGTKLTPSPYVSRYRFFSSFQKVTVSIFALVLLVSGGVWFATRQPSSLLQDSQPTVVSDTIDSSNAPAVSPSAPSDTSDQGLDQDVGAIDAQMNALNSDTANID
jgi:hypothetical protein